MDQEKQNMGQFVIFRARLTVSHSLVVVNHRLPGLVDQASHQPIASVLDKLGKTKLVF